ncbi:FAD-binding oxidoreductase [Pseudomonas sp. MS15a(2019)]|uniref:NAD(P)/FAD-dependent oxidoreductase n=1 Tax=Pseudomonas sp. MS15a(2019) TaxID=2579938 RepID=UPI001562F8C6|nr:FAD-binding oxidoreductase [Pseudomonas sp. MS15a(2019)]NRH41083.1 FAD-binding oxidoreductase [Pseudomonas sp. MS15a(2019)]
MSQNAANQADVIIVGAGIMGSASAFFLRRRGLSVLLLERDQVGRFASGTNFGNVRRQGRYLSQVALATRSRGVWGRLPELIGEDLEFIPGGHLRVVYDSSRIAMLHEYAQAPETAALELQVLEGAALHEKFPYLGPEVVAGSYAPHDGHANPRLAAPAFARAAVREGVNLQEGVEITQVTKPGGDFLVQAADGRRYQAPRLLITAGAWGSRLSSQFGEPVPIETHGPQMGVTEPLPYVFREAVGVSSPLVSETIYFRQIPRGNVIFGGCFRTRPDLDTRLARAEPHGLLNQLTQLRRLAPALGRVSVIRTWSGVEGYIADDLPIMGPSSQVEGLYYAFGFCGAGFQLGPGVGDTMAELIATGHTDTPLAAFDVARFAQPRRESLAG